MRYGKTPGKIIFVTVIIFFLFTFGATAEPELRPEKEGKIHLGMTTEGQLKAGSFTVTNTGDSRLMIEHYMVNCTCLEITSSSDENLDPGESGEYKFVFDTTGLGGKETEKEVIVFSNAPGSPHRIAISTQVRPKATYQTGSEEIIDGFSLLVDVRSPEQFKRGHIIGAKNVQKKDFSDWAKTLPEGIKLYVYSREGKISDRLVENLKSNLPLNLKSLVGGYLQWELAHESYLVENGE
ncbi:DUF1573 domain-containing protein [Candidatus Bipolaricaulota bacterium]|nr:DUF1573 domain-containing protein [Candidatus Bipolaricaulota bacterium]